MYLKSVGGIGLSAGRVVSLRDLTIHFLSLPMERGDGCRQNSPPGRHLHRVFSVFVCGTNIALAPIHTVSLAVV